MANLGTLDFDVRLKDETARQAEEIKSNLLTKLSVNFDPSSYENMIANLRSQLSRETFEVKIATNMETARQSIQNSLNQIGQSARSATVDLDLGGTQGISSISREIIELQRHIHSLTQDVEGYKAAWKEASRVHGQTSYQAKAAFEVYDKERQHLEDQKHLLFSLRRDKESLALSNREAAKAEKEASKAAKESEKAQKEAAKAEKERYDTHVRLNGELMKGVRVSADLKEAFTSLYSVHMLREFLSNVIEIGGQLEKQRVSMGAILGDTAKANVLFEQIKDLAVKSPFGVVELDQYTKQLAAYGFEYNELFDMIKRLADISAGAGQDISRLTLALGHVKSQTYLTGYTMRQFSMNNIPMLKMLSEYYSELEGTMVKTADVQERISKKQVSYEDVIEQIRRLTNEGGMFYDMQEKISDTVAAKWKNLRDAFSIMYGEMAEGRLGDVLKDIASGLTKVALHGEKVIGIMSSLAIAYGTYKAAVFSLNAARAISIAIDEAVVLHRTISAMAGLTTATKAQVIWQGILNTVTAVNPYAAILSVIAALGAAYIFLGEKTKTLEEVQEDFNEELEMQEQNLRKEEESAKRYAKVLADTTKSVDARNKAYDELEKLYPNYFNALNREEAMLYDVETAMKRVSQAARQRSIDMAQTQYDEAVQKRIEAEKKLQKAIPDSGVGIMSGWFGRAVYGATGNTESQARQALALAEEEERLAQEHLDTLKNVNDAIEELQSQRWFTESEKFAGAFKDLIPTEGEARTEYFDRIGKEINSLRSQIDSLNSSSDAAKEVLPELQSKLAATENIYYKALGGARKPTSADKQAKKDMEDARKEAERMAKEQLQLAVKEMNDYISREGSRFNLYKLLLGKTGDENFARQAFSGGQMWNEYTNKLRERLESSMNMAVTNWNMSESLAEKVFGKDTPALKLYQEIVKEIGENYTNALTEAADAMSKMQTTEEKIANLQRQINEWENDTSGLVDRTAQIEAAKNEVEELKQSLFSTLPVYEQIFGDTAYRSIGSIKEGIRQMNEIISNARENKDSKTSKAKSISSSYIDSDGVKQEVTLTLAEFRRLKEQGTKLFDAWKDKNPFSGLIEAFKNIRQVLNSKDIDPEEKAEQWAKFASTIADCADIVGDFAGKLSDMFDSLGNEGMASAMEDVQAGMNSISNIGKGFAQGGVFGGAIAAAGEVVGWIGRIAGVHDKKLDKSIEKSQREVKKLQNAYKNLEWEVGRQLTAITQNQTKQMLESLNQQRRELEKQRELEAKKKKSDPSKLIDYDQQIEEMKHQIADFYKEMANDMYGIDIDGWAGQIADAITNAFAKGEDAVSAFNDTVADIMNSVVKNIIKINVVKPAMEQLQDYLFNSKNGIATLNSEGGATITPAEAKGLIEQLDVLRGKINDGRTIYETVAEAMRALGIDPMGDSTSTKSGLSKGIQGTTEETSNLLASYLNAVRADVSVIRRIMEMGSSTEDNPVSQAQLLQLQVIAQNTAQTAMNTEAISDIYGILRNNINGVGYFHIQ